MPFVGEAHGDAVVAKGPDFLDEAVVELAVPLARQECLDRLAALQKLRAVAPAAVGRIGERDASGIARIPGVFGQARLLGCGFGGERRQWRAVHGGDPRLTFADRRSLAKRHATALRSCHVHAASRCLAGGDNREVDVGLGDFVDVIRPGVERDVQHDLDHLRIVIAGGLDGLHVVFTDMAAFARDLDGEAYGGVGLGIVGARRCGWR